VRAPVVSSGPPRAGAEKTHLHPTAL